MHLRTKVTRTIKIIITDYDLSFYNRKLFNVLQYLVIVTISHPIIIYKVY